MSCVEQVDAPPRRLRAQVPVDSKAESVLSNGNDAQGHKKEPKVVARVMFTCAGQTLSGIGIAAMTQGSSEFSVGEHSFKAGRFLCS